MISGEDADFGKGRELYDGYTLTKSRYTDVTDLRNYTVYQNGYFDHHPIIRSLWQIVEDFNSEEKRAFLKFVTSCPKVSLVTCEKITLLNSKHILATIGWIRLFTAAVHNSDGHCGPRL